MSNTPQLHRCSFCFKSYKRRVHLRRHSGSHKADRPYRCHLCNSTFQRADVLKRHLQNCDGKSNRLLGQVARRRACDRCVQQKRACNLCQPCQNCLKKAALCNYSLSPTSGGTMCNTQVKSTHSLQDSLAVDGTPSFPTAITASPLGVDNANFDGPDEYTFNLFDSGLFDYSSGSWQEFFNLTSENQAPLESSLSGKDCSYCFNFLGIFTSQTGFVSSFDCGTLAQRQEVVSSLGQLESAFEHDTRQSKLSYNLPFTSGQDEQLTSTTVSAWSGNPLGTTPLTQQLWFSDPLAFKTHRILLLVKEVMTVKPRNSVVTLAWSPVLEQMCLRFFSPLNLRRLLEFYWAIWNPNVNFLHRPTFDPASSKSVLLASMALIGACVSPDSTTNQDAKIWFECIEEVAFTDDDFGSHAEYTGDSPYFETPRGRRNVQALQAAYMVCLYQNWEGTDASKRRIRRYRYGTVVSVARDIGISTARHPNYSLQPRNQFDWHNFVAREELIRIFLWIFLMDLSFVIFNNLPPRMVIKEMKMQMACPEACFQASTSVRCVGHIQTWMLDGGPACQFSFCAAVERLCKKPISPDIRESLAYLGPLNLFAATSALHTLIFQYQNSFGGEEQLTPIRNALSNWKEIWELYSCKLSSTPPHSMVDSENLTPDNMWKRIGFMRHAPEFWLLACLIIDRTSTLSVQQQENGAKTCPGGFTPIESRPLDPILNKYDETSMRQVNDLIADFQKVHIHW